MSNHPLDDVTEAELAAYTDSDLLELIALYETSIKKAENDLFSCQKFLGMMTTEQARRNVVTVVESLEGKVMENTSVFCPSCGLKQVIVEPGDGDYYVGATYHCKACKDKFHLP